MKRFKDKNLTIDEWEEVFRFFKIFEVGEVVECGCTCNSGSILWKVMSVKPHRKGAYDNFYLLKNIVDGRDGWFSSTFMQPLGTFVDDKFFTKEKI